MINANNNNSNNNHSAVNTLLFIISHGEGSLNHLWASFNSFSSSTADNSNSNNARKQLAWLFSAFIWCSLLDVSLGGSVTAANCNCCHCRWTLKANFMLGIVFFADLSRLFVNYTLTPPCMEPSIIHNRLGLVSFIYIWIE